MLFSHYLRQLLRCSGWPTCFVCQLWRSVQRTLPQRTWRPQGPSWRTFCPLLWRWRPARSTWTSGPLPHARPRSNSPARRLKEHGKRKVREGGKKTKQKQKKKKKKKKKERERAKREVCQTEKGSCEQSAGGEVGHALEAAAGSMGLLGLAQRALACCRTCVHCRHMISIALPSHAQTTLHKKEKKKLKRGKQNVKLGSKHKECSKGRCKKTFVAVKRTKFHREKPTISTRASTASCDHGTKQASNTINNLANFWTQRKRKAETRIDLIAQSTS